jgi:glutathionylspermidine synthase
MPREGYCLWIKFQIDLSKLRTGTRRYPVLDLWMIDQECGGMGIREDATPITGNLSSFVPHLFR